MKEIRRILLKLQKRAEGDPVKKERKKTSGKKMQKDVEWLSHAFTCTKKQFREQKMSSVKY